MNPRQIVIPFFNPSRDGLTFIMEDEDGTALDPLDIWEKIEVHVFKGRDYKNPVLIKSPFIDGDVVSIEFSSEAMNDFFSRSEYRIEPRFFSGGDFDTYFFYKVNLNNMYTL